MCPTVLTVKPFCRQQLLTSVLMFEGFVYLSRLLYCLTYSLGYVPLTVMEDCDMVVDVGRVMAGEKLGNWFDPTSKGFKLTTFLEIRFIRKSIELRLCFPHSMDGSLNAVETPVTNTSYGDTSSWAQLHLRPNLPKLKWTAFFNWIHFLIPKGIRSRSSNDQFSQCSLPWPL